MMNPSDDQSPNSSEFLPLNVRRVLYIIGLISSVMAPILGVTFPAYLDPILQAGIILQGAALGTALANTAKKH